MDFFLMKIWPYKGNFTYGKNFLAWKFFSMVQFFCKYTHSKAHQKLTIRCWNNFLKKHKKKFFRQKWFFSLWNFDQNPYKKNFGPRSKICFGLRELILGRIFFSELSFDSLSNSLFKTFFWQQIRHLIRILRPFYWKNSPFY